MASAGDVTINFAAETAKFTAELKKVRGELNSLRGATASISRQMRTAGQAILGVFSGAALVAGIRAVVQATTESEQAIAQLDSALQSAGTRAGVTSSQLQAFATQMQRTSTFTDEAVLGVETLLLSFRGLSGDTITRATAAVLDLSTRMGTDLRSSSIAVAKALSDPERGLTALTRAGVLFSESQKDLIKNLVDTGRLADAQGLILRELEGRFGGAAAAARNTLGGALTAVKNNFGDLLEGDKASMKGMVVGLNNLADTLTSPEIKAGFAGLIQSIAAVGTAAANSIGWLVRFGDAAGRAAARGLVRDADLTAAQVLSKELRNAETIYTRHKTSGFFTDDQLAEEQAYIETLKQRIQLAERAQELAVAPRNPRGGGRPGGGRGVPSTPDLITADPSLEQLQLLQSISEQRLAITQREGEEQWKILEETAARREAFDQEQLARATSISQQRLAITMREFDENSRMLAEQQALDEQYQQAKLQLQQDTVNAGIGLLQFMAQKSKTAAVALILINRGLMIAQTIQSTAAAVMKAFAVYGPTPAGYAAAASMKLIGAIQVGLIAATGALEIGAVRGGDSNRAVGPGTPNNPLHTDAVSEPSGSTDRGSTQVFINGVVTREVIDQLLDGLRDGFGRDIVIIPAGSAQARVILES
jgi:hypothetical protein